MNNKRLRSNGCDSQKRTPVQAPRGAPVPEGSGFEIKIEGHLDRHWSAWFGGLSISHDTAGNTVLSGAIQDQAALHGIMAKIRDLGLPLVSVARLEAQAQSREGSP